MRSPTLRIETARTDDGSMAAWVERWFGDWAQTFLGAYAEGRPGAPQSHPEEELGGLRRESATYVTVVAAAVEDGPAGEVVVAAAKVMLALRDNLDVASVDVGVAVAHRRRGVGTAMLEWAREVSAAAGRSSLLAEIDHPDGTGDDWPGVQFARAAGLSFACPRTRARPRCRCPPTSRRAWRRRSPRRRPGTACGPGPAVPPRPTGTGSPC